MRQGAPESDLPALLGIRFGTADASGRTYAAYPSVAKVRWLLPTDQPVLRRAGMKGLYQPASLRGRVLGGLIGAGVVPGERVRLEEEALASLEATLASIFGEQDMRLAFYVGVPSPHRKITTQVLTPGGETLAYARIATSPLAREAVETERRTLLRLSRSEDLRGKVPEVLGSFDWHGGTVLVLTMGSGRPGPKRLSPAHANFFADVFRASEEPILFEECHLWTRMHETWRRLQPGSPEALPTQIGPALELLHGELGAVLLPSSLAHGDFAPWNTRMGPRSLFVFDWERASEGMIPLYDAFNFQALQAALRGERGDNWNGQFLTALLDDLWPDGRRHLPILYLAYLTDILLLYSEAQSLAPGVGERKVWGWFARRVESFLEGALPS